MDGEPHTDQAVATAQSGTVAQSKIGSGWVTPIELTLLGAIWGASFLFMRIAARDFGPFALVEVRLSLGALVLLPFLWRSRSSFAPRVIWRLAGIGIINSAIPFVLFAWGAERAPAGIGAITNAMTAATAQASIRARRRSLPRAALGIARRILGAVGGHGHPQQPDTNQPPDPTEPPPSRPCAVRGWR